MPKNQRDFKAVLILCEGKTDVAFIRRVLLSEHYTDYKKNINEFESPLKEYFSNKLKDFDYDAGTVFDRPLVPVILRRAHGNSLTYALLYSVEGDNVENYSEIISDYKVLMSNQEDEDSYERELLGETFISLIFLLDADNKSVNEKIEYLKEHFRGLIPQIEYLSDQRMEIDTPEFKLVSLCILCDPQSNSGNLEDIILEMLKPEGNDLIEYATTFLKHFQFQRKSEAKQLSDFKKSIVGIVGQVEVSGLDNANIIKLTRLFNDKLQTHPKCLEILATVSKSRQALQK